MIQIAEANNSTYKTDNLTLELKEYLNQIATTQNLREQLVNQIYIITDIQQAINNNSLKDKIDIFLERYNNSISRINSNIISTDDKLHYFNINQEKSSYEKQTFTLSLANKCKEVENIFNQVALLNAQAIKDAKKYVSTHQKLEINNYAHNIDINNILLANNV